MAHHQLGYIIKKIKIILFGGIATVFITVDHTHKHLPLKKRENFYSFSDLFFFLFGEYVIFIRKKLESQVAYY